jgi:hypothetical protein
MLQTSSERTLGIKTFFARPQSAKDQNATCTWYSLPSSSSPSINAYCLLAENRLCVFSGIAVAAVAGEDSRPLNARVISRFHRLRHISRQHPNVCQYLDILTGHRSTAISSAPHLPPPPFFPVSRIVCSDSVCIGYCYGWVSDQFKVVGSVDCVFIRSPFGRVRTLHQLPAGLPRRIVRICVIILHTVLGIGLFAPLSSHTFFLSFFFRHLFFPLVVGDIIERACVAHVCA